MFSIFSPAKPYISSTDKPFAKAFFAIPTRSPYIIPLRMKRSSLFPHSTGCQHVFIRFLSDEADE
jgi:hypothetical protein